MFGVCVREMKAFTVKVKTVAVIGKVESDMHCALSV